MLDAKSLPIFSPAPVTALMLLCGGSSRPLSPFSLLLSSFSLLLSPFLLSSLYLYFLISSSSLYLFYISFSSLTLSFSSLLPLYCFSSLALSPYVILSSHVIFPFSPSLHLSAFLFFPLFYPHFTRFSSLSFLLAQSLCPLSTFFFPLSYCSLLSSLTLLPFLPSSPLNLLHNHILKDLFMLHIHDRKKSVSFSIGHDFKNNKTTHL